MQRCLPHTVMSNTVEQCCHATELQRIFRTAALALFPAHTNWLTRYTAHTVHSRAENCVSSMYTTLSTLERNINVSNCDVVCATETKRIECTPNATDGEQAMMLLL